MNLRNYREIKAFAAQRLAQSDSQQKIVAVYAVLALGLMAAATVLSYVLGLQIDRFGGLSNLGKRTMLSSLQSMLPMIQSLLDMCLYIGYLAAMLRIARGMYTSLQTLRLGFDRFWLLLRCAVFRGLIMTGVMMGSIYLGILIYMATPFSDPAVELIVPLLSQASLLDSGIVMDPATYSQLMEAMLPAFVFCGIVMLVLGGPVLYSYRMVNYIVIDQPGIGAIRALTESKKMMRRNRLHLLKLDVSLWWYYLASAAAVALCYGDVLLPMLGIRMPVPQTAAYFGFFALYLAASFCVHFFLRNRVEVCYALAYDTLKPEQKQESGVVLGNIFQM